jgi:hypothetical protein
MSSGKHSTHAVSGVPALMRAPSLSLSLSGHLLLSRSGAPSLALSLQTSLCELQPPCHEAHDPPLITPPPTLLPTVARSGPLGRCLVPPPAPPAQRTRSRTLLVSWPASPAPTWAPTCSPRQRAARLPVPACVRLGTTAKAWSPGPPGRRAPRATSPRWPAA